MAMTAGSPFRLGRGPLADQLTGEEVVGRERDVDSGRRVRRRVEGDHVETGLTGGIKGRDDRIATGSDEDAGVAAGHGLFDRSDLRGGVAILLAGGNGERDAEGGGFGFG